MLSIISIHLQIIPTSSMHNGGKIWATMNQKAARVPATPKDLIAVIAATVGEAYEL